jgi:hypothetical protein
MKKIIATFILIIYEVIIYACPVCERQQPKILKGVVHGLGPQDNWDYISVWVTIIIVVLSLFFSIKYLVKPGEKNQNHIKYTILNNQ